MSDVLMIRTADIDDLNAIGYLAYQVWPATYKEILSFDELYYMLQHFYSPTALREQMMVKQHTFLIAETEEEEPVGFASYSQVEKGVFKLHKLYVLPSTQGKSVGKSLLEVVEEECKEAGGKKLLVNVNRFNKAKSFYEKHGFEIIKEEDIDLGEGVRQEDYVLEKSL